MLFNSITGMSKEEFKRKAGLMRNPEGLEKPGRCPVCKAELKQNDQGDLYCSNYSSGYEKDGGCYWHRYKDGLNYWSSPEEMFKAMVETDPEFKTFYDQAMNDIS